MKGFKKVLAVLLTVAMVGAMAVGCGSKGDDKKRIRQMTRRMTKC